MESLMAIHPAKACIQADSLSWQIPVLSPLRTLPPMIGRREPNDHVGEVAPFEVTVDKDDVSPFRPSGPIHVGGPVKKPPATP